MNIMGDIISLVADWPRYAEKAGVGEERMREIALQPDGGSVEIGRIF